MVAIFRRELGSYFKSMIGYVYLAVFFFFAGYAFMNSSLYTSTTDLSSVFSFLFTVILFIAPIVTMRLFSEDRKLKTDQAILTAPVSLYGLIFGKFFGAFVFYGLGVSITLVYAVVVSAFGLFGWFSLLANLFGLLLLGAALISIGMFISALTEDQIVAAVGSFAVMLLLILVDSFASGVSNPFLSNLLTQISFNGRYSSFTMGMIDIMNVLFFVSVTGIFIFLTVRVFEKRRW